MENTQKDEHHGLKSRRTPPHIPELKDIESDLASLIQGTKFKKTINTFQQVLKNDIRNISSSKDIIVAADKTRNMYIMSQDKYDKLASNRNTQNNRKGENNISYAMATECKNLSRKHNIENHLHYAKSCDHQINGHKENLTNDNKCRLINPTKTEIGKVSKNIVDKMNASIRCKADANQRRSTKEVIRWFNNLENKKQLSYLTFDIVDFHQSITDNPLNKTLKWAQKYHNIAVTEFDAKMHARTTIPFDHKGIVWTKKTKKNSSTCQWELMMVLIYVNS